MLIAILNDKVHKMFVFILKIVAILTRMLIRLQLKNLLKNSRKSLSFNLKSRVKIDKKVKIEEKKQFSFVI